MKKFMKIVSLFLVLIISLGAFTACNTGDKPGDSGNSNPVYPTYVGGKPHKIIAEKTEEFIAIAGKTDYQVVISPNADTNTLTAIEELNRYMNLAAGVTFNVIHETGLTVDENSKYLVLGNTQLAKNAGIDIKYSQLGNDGYIIKTIGKTVYLGGYSGNGDIFAVYEFMKHTVGYTFYTIMTTVYNKTQVVNLYNFDVIDVPDFAQRITGTSGWQSGHYSQLTVKRYRNDLTDEAMLHPSQLEGYGHFHNTKWWLPYSNYGEDHPSWYSDSVGNEFCYTAHGNQEEYEAMQDELIQRIVLSCKRWPSATNVNITHNDYGYKCSCETCMQHVNRCGGSYAGVIISFMNDLVVKLNDYMATNEDNLPRDRTFTIQAFAYSYSIIPPVVLGQDGKPQKDADGKYTLLEYYKCSACGNEQSNNDPCGKCEGEVVKKDYKANENVHMWFAPLSAQFVDPLSHIDNAVQYEQYQAWQQVCDKVDFWLYGTNFQNVLAPYLGITSFVENLREFVADGNDGLVLYEQESSPVGIAFKKLQGFITANISWNVKYDVTKLMNDYFANVYGPAEKTMRTYYNDMTTYLYSMIEAGVLAKDVYAGTRNNKELFTQAVCERWLRYTEKALTEIESIKESDPARYQIYYDEIINESIMPRYYLIKFYEDQFSPGQANEMKKSLLNDSERVSAYIEEGYNVWEEYMGSWRNEIW